MIAARESRPLDLFRLRSLVRAAAATREQRTQWHSYLFSLRPYADLDGILPPQFTPLVEEIFGELLAASSERHASAETGLQEDAALAEVA